MSDRRPSQEVLDAAAAALPVTRSQRGQMSRGEIAERVLNGAWPEILDQLQPAGPAGALDQALRQAHLDTLAAQRDHARVGEEAVREQTRIAQELADLQAVMSGVDQARQDWISDNAAHVYRLDLARIALVLALEHAKQYPPKGLPPDEHLELPQDEHREQIGRDAEAWLPIIDRVVGVVRASTGG